MATFALVHGAWHAAWCWERLAPELEARGHEVITMDLPSDVPGAGFDECADVVAAALDRATSRPLIVVGHSLAGLTIPLVPARREVDQLVYVCGVPPRLGSSFLEQVAAEPDMLDTRYVSGLGEVDAEGNRGWVDPALAIEFMYADCDDETARAAVERLRPQSVLPYRTATSLREFPDVPATYVLCTEDRLVQSAWSERIAKDWLGAQVVRLPGSHSPFLSRPRDLAPVLDRLGRTNVDTVMEVLDLFGRGESRALFDNGLVAPDAELRPARELTGERTYAGPDELEQFMGEWTESFEDWSFETLEVVECGEAVAVRQRQRGVGRDSGAAVELVFGTVFRLEAGQVKRTELYVDFADALEAAGCRGRPGG
jgi:pimeloyl-ACP methyl ester carboxylesterase/ketosteroid isomerase-like protein